MFYRLLIGAHAEGGRVYREGDVFESRMDLTVFNGPKSVKFEEVSVTDPQAPESVRRLSGRVSPDDMTTDELRRLAEDERLDVTGLDTRAEILAVIKEVLGAPS